MAIRYKAVSAITGMIAIVLAAVSPAFAVAFSGIGAGTLANPYRITTCAQLGEMASNLTAYYVLNNDINCNSATFTPVGGLGGSTPFSGTLDGLNHTIENINFTNCGIFCSTSGATIKNISITSGTFTIPQHYYYGSFVGYANNTTMTNLHSALAITADSYDYVGGIVGFMNNTDTVNDSSFTGSITLTGTDGYAGGITGFLWASDDSISNSYAAANITLASTSSLQSASEIVGGSFAGTLTNVYGAGTLTDHAASGSFNSIGALIATASGSTITNSFAATPVSGSNTVGALFGSSSITVTNTYFDQTVAGTSSCAGSGTATCTAANISNANPTYFFNNTVNHPLNTWDFATIWTANAAGYPTLRNTAVFSATGIPNSGDANGDGTADAYQPNVFNVKDSNGIWATVTVPNSSCDLGDGASTGAGSVALPNGYTALTNLTSFRIYCSSTGASVPVSVIFDKVYTNPVARYYNASTHAYSLIPGAIFTTVTIGGTAKTKLSYTLTDGAALDEDDTANGIIVDPIGLYSAVIAAPDTGYGLASSRYGTTAAYAALGIGMVLAGATILRKQLRP